MKKETLHLIRVSARVRPEIRQLEHESDSHFAKRCEAIEQLGAGWLRHPSYVFRPLHSHSPEVWGPAHRVFWHQVHVAAEEARNRNPAYLRAQRVRDAVGDQS